MIYFKNIFILICFISLYLPYFHRPKKPLPESEFYPKIDYDNSLTSLACSIEKYFNITPLHKTLPYIDQLFEEKKPENVILLLCDGMGSRIMDKILNKDDYLIKNRKAEIFSVFPPTTASCLTSIKTGLNPSEHGWLGWSTYVPPIDKIINLYKDTQKGTKLFIDEDYIAIKDKYYYDKKTITELINDKGQYKAYELNCYPYNVERNIDKVFEKILETLNNEGKKYIFTYYPQPDDILHSKGYTSFQAQDEMKKINAKVEEYSKKILEYKNTMLIIVADHGHLIVDKKNIYFSKINKYLSKPYVFIENRNPAFLVKKGYEKEFIKAFNKDFGNDFFLLSKKDILKYQIFGEYAPNNKHKFFENSFGDFMAFAKDGSNKALKGKSDGNLYSYHGGYSDDEIYIPLIVVSN